MWGPGGEIKTITLKGGDEKQSEQMAKNLKVEATPNEIAFAVNEQGTNFNGQNLLLYYLKPKGNKVNEDFRITTEITGKRKDENRSYRYFRDITFAGIICN